MDDKGSILNVDGPSILKTELHVPRPDMEEKSVKFKRPSLLHLRS